MEYGPGLSLKVGMTQDVVVTPEKKTKCGNGGGVGVRDDYFMEKRAKKREKSGIFFFGKTEKNLAI